MRCGPGTVILKLYFPLLSALVLLATSMPLARLMRMTSSPAAGLLVVPLVTVPVRVWAAAEARVSAKIAASNADCASLIKTSPSNYRSQEFLENPFSHHPYVLGLSVQRLTVY